MRELDETKARVVDLRVYRDPSYTPVIVLVDLQKEYLSRHRALRLNGVEKALEKCRRLVDVARSRGFPIAFMRWAQKSKFFNAVQDYSAWIDGFTPLGSDMVFERSMPSCYANKQFAEMMDSGGGENAVLAGFTGTIACLSTIVDAYSRGHRITFHADASASHALDSRSGASTHGLVSQIISLYGPVTTTDQWIAEQTHTHQQRRENRQ